MVNWITRLFRRREPPGLGRYITWAGADWDTGGEVTSGVSVNESSALNYAACWCATRVIAETVACLPAIVYQRTSRGRERAETHPLYRLIHHAPTDEMSAVVFHEYLTMFLVNWGTAYAEIIRAGAYDPIALRPLHSGYVDPYRDPDGELYFIVRDELTGSQRRVPGTSMFRVVGALSDNGVTGRGVIRQARESIGMGVATERFGAAFFGNGARPGGLLEHPGNPSEEAERRIRASWDAMHKGPANSGKTALLREGMTYKQLGIPPEDAQFLETRQHNVTEIARWYRIPPHMLADLTRATFSNIEQQSIDFVTHSVMPWLRRWEAAYNTQLLRPEEPYYVEFLVDGLLRGDTVSRTAAAAQQFLNGALTLNEWRAMENRNSVEGEAGDTHFVPLNLVPIDRALEPPPEPMPPVVPPPDDEEKEDEDPAPDEEQQQRAIHATADALSAEIARLRVKEANAIRRATNKPKAFVSVAEQFYVHHRETLADALLPVVRAHRIACGLPADVYAVEAHAKRIADEHCDKAMQDVLAASECSAADLPAAIDQLTKTWANQRKAAA